MQIALVPAQRADLVVTEEDMNASTFRKGLGFEVAQQPKELRDLCTTIKDVADDHEVVVTKSPILLSVDDVVGLKQLDQTAQIAMDVAHSGNAIRSGKFSWPWDGRGRIESQGTKPGQFEFKRSTQSVFMTGPLSHGQHTCLLALPKHIGTI